jgi:hypothetical protein
MTSRLIEKNLNSVRQQLKWLVVGQRLGTAGAIFCLIWLLLQAAALERIFTQLWLLYLLIFLQVVAGLITFVVIFAVTFGRDEKRTMIGNALEKSCPPLLDRVNTLIYLEENPYRFRSIGLKKRIEEQADKVFQVLKPTAPFSPNRCLAHLGFFIFLLAAVILIEERYHPFQSLHNEAAATATKPSAPFELAPQKDVIETQAKKSWGEVRIVDPGHDVRLTKIDVLPLQIEMTASDAMEKPVWITSVNGGDESTHDLSAPTNPNYMVYQPLIYLDQLQVTEWDVVSYYAKVHSAAPADYASPLSFIEIRPFREDILKMTGSKDGKQNRRYQLLSELTGLIKQQTILLQDTHQHIETTYAHDDLRLQDAQKLSAGESQLATATSHFYGEIASESENTPVGDILDHLSQAGDQMTRATQALQDDVAQEGRQREQNALTHLIACRKAFQKAIMNNPDAFGGDSSDAIADQPPVKAAESLKALSQVSEMRNRDKDGLQSLHQLTQRQKALATAHGLDNPTAERQQIQLKSDFHDLIDRNPDLFSNSGDNETKVQENMTQATMKLSSGKDDGKSDMARAADSLKDLEGSVTKRLGAQQLAEAYKLKKIIEQNVQQLSQEKNKPGTLSSQEVQDLTNSAQHSTSTLKDIVDNDTNSGFGPQLGQSLSADKQQSLNKALDKFSNSPSGPGRSSAAGDAAQDMQGISQAFDQSQPALTNKIRGQDQLQPQPANSLDQATQDLQSAILMAESSHPNSPDQQAKALAQILGELDAGTKDSKLGGIVHDKLMADAIKMLKQKVPGEGADPATLKKLLDEIETVRLEANDANQPKPPELNTTQIDPNKFPPAYRERLKTYFEQLSQPSH